MITRKVTLKKLAEWIPILQDVGCVSKHADDDRDEYEKWKWCAERNKKRFQSILNENQKKLEQFAEKARATIDKDKYAELEMAEHAIVAENCDKTHDGIPVKDEHGEPSFNNVGVKKVKKLIDDLHVEMKEIIDLEEAARETIDKHCKESMEQDVEVLIFSRPNGTIPLNIDGAYLEGSTFMIRDVPTDDEIED